MKALNIKEEISSRATIIYTIVDQERKTHIIKIRLASLEETIPHFAKYICKTLNITHFNIVKREIIFQRWVNK